MTREFEHKLRRIYGNMTKNDLIETIIELQKRNEVLRESCIETTDCLRDVAKEIREVGRILS